MSKKKEKYYHVRITKKSRRTQDIVELDFSESELKTRVVKNYHEGKLFICDGVAIDPYDVEKIKINQTEEDSIKLIPIIQQERIQSSVLTLISDEWYVADKGKNVTNVFIKHPPFEKKGSSKIDLDWKIPFTGVNISISNLRSSSVLEFIVKNRKVLLTIILLFPLPFIVNRYIDHLNQINSEHINDFEDYWIRDYISKTNLSREVAENEFKLDTYAKNKVKNISKMWYITYKEEPNNYRVYLRWNIFYFVIVMLNLFLIYKIYNH